MATLPEPVVCTDNDFGALCVRRAARDESVVPGCTDVDVASSETER